MGDSEKEGLNLQKTFDEMFNEWWFARQMKYLQKVLYQNAKNHGFHEDDTSDFAVATKIALIGSEVFEALHAHQKRQDDHIGEELADVVIRTMDLAETLGINLGDEIIKKHNKNINRPYKHGDKRY